MSADMLDVSGADRAGRRSFGRDRDLRGKFHQIKRMFAAVGCKVVSARRNIRFGPLKRDPALGRGEMAVPHGG